jgi:hypothetical protein
VDRTRGQLGNPEEGERPASEAVARGMVKTQMFEEIYLFAIANCRLHRYVKCCCYL